MQTMITYLAQQVRLPNPTPGGADIILEGPLRPELASAGVGGIISMLLSVLYAVAAVIVFFLFVWGGFDILTSGGNAEKTKSGSAKITSGVIGFVLLIMAFFITRLVAFIFGLDTSFLF